MMGQILIIISFLAASVFSQVIFPDRKDQTEKEFRKELDSKLSSLDFIEGIWIVKNTGVPQNNVIHRIGIVRDTVNPSYEFTAFIVESYRKSKKGQLKAKFRKTAYENLFEGLWYTEQGKDERSEFYINQDGRVYSKSMPIEFVKAYPSMRDFYSKSTKSTDKKSLTNSYGTGVLLSTSGLVATCYHVIEGSSNIQIQFPVIGYSCTGEIRLKDINNDIAILSCKEFDRSKFPVIPFNIMGSEKIKMGQEVFTLGFPLADYMGKTPRLSNGKISSEYGINDDPRIFQISNPIQPGNSGGPLFNDKGHLVGLTVASLSAKYFLEKDGIVPQNINFAIKSNYLKNVLTMIPEGEDVVNRKVVSQDVKSVELIESLKKFIAQIKSTQ